MTSFERALFEIAEELIHPYDLVPSYAPDYAEMWREVEAYDIPEKRIPTEDDLWKMREYEEWFKLYDSVDADILAYVESGLPEVDDVSTGKNRKRAERRARKEQAKSRRAKTLINLGFDPEMLTPAERTRRLSELYGQIAWKNIHESSKIARHNPNLSGKGCAYKKVRGWWD